MAAYFTRILCISVLLLSAGGAIADEVVLENDDIKLLGDFVSAEEAGDKVALITHGTLAHKDMELVEALQEAMAERGVSSLAHTLSLGVTERRGSVDCTMDHRHLDEDADAEIAVWYEWLRAQGHHEVVLVGHSRGAKQVARSATALEELSGVVLMAPALSSSAKRSRSAFVGLDSLLDRAKESKPDHLLSLDRFIYCDNAKASAESVLSYYGGDAVGADTFVKDIAAPVLVIAGTADEVVPDVAAVFEPLRSERVSLQVIEDADHMFLDFFVEDAAELISTFLVEEADVDDVDEDEDFELKNAPLYEAADLDYGEYLASECASCHKADGADGVPGIAGYEAWYTHLALIQYANAERDNAAMRLVAKSLDDEQRIAVSAYLATQNVE